MSEKTKDGPEERKTPAKGEPEELVETDSEPEPKPKRRIKPLDKKLPEHPDGLAKRSEWFRKRRGEPD